MKTLCAAIFFCLVISAAAGDNILSRPALELEAVRAELDGGLSALSGELPANTRARITNPATKKEVIVTTREGSSPALEISAAAADALGLAPEGSTRVVIEVLGQRVPYAMEADEEEAPDGIEVLAPGLPERERETELPALTETPLPSPPPPIVAAPPAPVPPPAPAAPPAAAAPPTVKPAVPAGPPARVVPSVPPAGDRRRWRVQIGSFHVLENAQEVFSLAREAGYTPVYERRGNLYRLVLPSVPSADISALAKKLGSLGIEEIWLRPR